MAEACKVLELRPPRVSSERVIDFRPQLTRSEALAVLEDNLQQVYTLDGWRPQSASHPVEGPDAAGRPSGEVLAPGCRPRTSVRVRFVRASGSASVAEIVGTAAYRELRFAVTDGVAFAYEIGNERSYQDYVQATNADANFTSVRRVVSSGLNVSGLVSHIPGAVRWTAKVSVTAFDGSGTDRTVTTVPVDGDYARQQWHCVASYDTMDVSLGYSLKALGLSASGGGAFLHVLVYAE